VCIQSVSAKNVCRRRVSARVFIVLPQSAIVCSYVFVVVNEYSKERERERVDEYASWC